MTDFETFFAKAPKINPSRALIKGVVCSVRVEDIKEPTMREIRYLDKLIDELAQRGDGQNFAKEMILSDQLPYRLLTLFGHPACSDPCPVLGTQRKT
jgi:hypothetical protein